MAYIDPFSKIQTEKSIIGDVLILPIFFFSTHIHCCIDSARTVFNQQVLRLTNKFDFQNRLDHYFPELLGTSGRKRQRSDDHHLVIKWYLSCQNIGRKIKHFHLLQISYYIFLAFHVFI